jgi:hypothetical protein
VALEEAQREANRKALKGERRTEKRYVPYLYRWAARTGFELDPQKPHSLRVEVYLN